MRWFVVSASKPAANGPSGTTQAQPPGGHSAERESVLEAQRSDGSWADRNYGDCYATAVNCLFLALPEGLLPVFQR